jgi:hypothetical protein
MTKRATTSLIFACLVLAAARAQAQASDGQLQVLRAMATPVGALPPIALPMPASRNHNYWITRVQSGFRKGPGGSSMTSGAAGLDFQYRGGSVFGVTAGYQERACGITGGDCGRHALFGARAQIGLMTGGAAMAALLHDNSTTSTFGTEIGFGYAPRVQSGLNSCTIDFGVPFSVAKRRQRPRLVAFIKPGVLWDFNCGSDGPKGRKSYFTDFGFGLQQVGNRSLDIYIGTQKMFRAHTGMQLGVTFTYVRLP